MTTNNSIDMWSVEGLWDAGMPEPFPIGVPVVVPSVVAQWALRTFPFAGSAGLANARGSVGSISYRAATMRKRLFDGGEPIRVSALLWDLLEMLLRWLELLLIRRLPGGRLRGMLR